VRPVIDQIVSLMTVPLVQGTLRYAWKVGVTGGVANSASSQTSKNKAEGATFAAAVLPLVHYCNSAAATTISDHMKFGAAAPTTADVKLAFETVYPCFGITCVHVGELMKNSTAPYPGMEKCTDDPSVAYDRWSMPPPPPPPPSKEVAGDDNNQISVQVTASGVVSDYDVAKQSALECAMADIAGVACNAVTVTITAASVILNFIIIAPPEKVAAIKATVTTALATTAGATAALGVPVEAVPTVSDVSSSEDDGLSAGAIAGIAIGVVAGLLLVGGIIFMLVKNKNVSPKEHSPA